MIIASFALMAILLRTIMEALTHSLGPEDSLQGQLTDVLIDGKRGHLRDESKRKNEFTAYDIGVGIYSN